MVCFYDGGMLIWVFHCCQKSHPPKYIPVFATYGFKIPLSPSGSIYSIHLTLCFTWDKVLIPKNWTFMSWKGLSGCQDSYEIIITSTLCLPHLQWHHWCIIFNFDLCLLIEVCKNSFFIVSPDFFVFSCIVVLLSTAVWFLTIGIKFFNCSGKVFPLWWQETTEPNVA